MTTIDNSRHVASRDGTRIAVFAPGTGARLLLVHGTAGDHTTFRVVGPSLATTIAIAAIDRRGRGASGDTDPYAIEREFEDVAVVAEQLASETGGPVAVFGHSYGGRCALGAALLTGAIDRVICYEGAPTPPGEPRPAGAPGPPSRGSMRMTRLASGTS
jgi:pimeloyl-ACP methyl ester carboxylesterase